MLDILVLNTAIEFDFKKEVRKDVLRVCRAEVDQELMQVDVEYEKMFRLLLEEVESLKLPEPTLTR